MLRCYWLLSMQISELFAGAEQSLRIAVAASFCLMRAAFFLASSRRILAAWRAVSICEIFCPFALLLCDDDVTTALLTFVLVLSGFLVVTTFLTLVGLSSCFHSLCLSSLSMLNMFCMSCICRQTMSQKPARSPSSVTNSPSFRALVSTLSF